MSIDSERIQQAFLAVVECPDCDGRAALIRHWAEGDSEFSARLTELLKAHDGPGELPKLALPLAPAEVGPGDACQAGLLVAGRYRLVAEIGEGGMGAVWLAEQIAPVRRRVALKLLKLGMDTRRVLARFEAERQALARMEHPFIAQVFDGGMTEFGRPFFVMEYVDGLAVTEYCDRARLTIRQRLRLFLDICAAAQHAHLKGIIHRDLKPSNVLVCQHQERAVPKIIDFGLAKALGEPFDNQAQPTGPALVMGTPRYMSPEQAEFDGADIDTRADVYSLGAILYELLTGSTPLDVAEVRHASCAAIMRQIQEAEPVRPSLRLKESRELPALAAARSCTPFEAPREVRGDLDWIALRALEKDRTRRYQSVGDLARDVDRYLNHRGVEARPPSSGYRFRKFARRNRAVLTASAVVFVSLVAGSVVSTTMAVRARVASRRAEAALQNEALHRQRAEQRETEAEKARAAEAAQRAIAQQERNDAEQRRARAELSLRNIRGAVEGHFQELRSNQALGAPHQVLLRRELLASALSYYRKLIDQQSDDPSLRLEYAHAYVRIGELSTDIGLFGQAAEAFRLAADRYEDLSRDPSMPGTCDADLAYALSRLAPMQEKFGRMADAEASYRCELEIRRKLVATSKDPDGQRLELGKSYCQLANLQRVLRRHADAEASFRQVFEIYDAMGPEAPSAVARRQYLADALYGWSQLQCATGHYRESARSLKRASLIYEQLAQEHVSQVPNYRASVAILQKLLGTVQRLDGQLGAARDSYNRSLEMYAALIRQDPSDGGFYRNRGSVHFFLGLLGSMAAQDTVARQQFTDALSCFDQAQALGYASPGFTASRADALAMLGRWADAAQTLAALVEPADSGCRERSQLALLYWAAGDRQAYRAICGELVAGIDAENRPGEIVSAVLACLVDPRAVDDWAPLASALERAAGADSNMPVYSTLAAAAQHRAGQTQNAIEKLDQCLPRYDSITDCPSTMRDSVRASRLVGETMRMIIERGRAEPDALSRRTARVEQLVEELKQTGPCYCDDADAWQVGFALVFAQRELAQLRPPSTPAMTTAVSQHGAVAK